MVNVMAKIKMDGHIWKNLIRIDLSLMLNRLVYSIN